MRYPLALFFLLFCMIAKAEVAPPVPAANLPAKAKAARKKVAVRPASRSAPKPVLSTDRHFFAGALFSTANQIHYKGQVNLFGAQTDYTATEQTSSAGGLLAGYMNRSPNGFGFSGSGAFEFVRKSQGIRGSAGGYDVQGTYQGNGGSNVATLGANGNYTVGTDFYIFAGANYPFTLFSQGGASLHGLPGYQGGIGYAFTDRISAELSYRVLRLSGSIDSPPFNLQVDEATFPGFILSLQYFF